MTRIAKMRLDVGGSFVEKAIGPGPAHSLRLTPLKNDLALNAYLSNLSNRAPTSLHDSNGQCIAATHTLLRLLQLGKSRVIGADLLTICSRLDPCLDAPALMETAMRIGGSAATIRPRIPGRGVMPLQLIAMNVRIEGRHLIQVTWVHEQEQATQRQKALQQLKGILNDCFQMPKDVGGMKDSLVRSLNRQLDIDGAILVDVDPDASQCRVASHVGAFQSHLSAGSVTTLNPDELSGFVSRRSQKTIDGIPVGFPGFEELNQVPIRATFAMAVMSPAGRCQNAILIYQCSSAPIPENAEAALQLVGERLALLGPSETRAPVNSETVSQAHELRNYLTCMQGALLQLERESAFQSSLTKPIQNLHAGIHGARQLINQMLNGPDAGPTHSRLIDLNQTLNEAADLVRPCAPEVEIESTNPPLIEKVRFRGQDLTLVLVNLMQNSIRAMESKGRIQLSLSVNSAGQPEIRVSDNGPGLPDALQARVFERRVTTHAGNGGHGLGLANARTLMRQNGGEISLDDAVSKGATFVLSFPEPGSGSHDFVNAESRK